MADDFDPNRLHKLADVLLMASSKSNDISQGMRWAPQQARTQALAMQIEGIAREFHAMAEEISRLLGDGERAPESH